MQKAIYSPAMDAEYRPMGSVPLGVALFPAELPMPPKSWIARSDNVQRWQTMT